MPESVNCNLCGGNESELLFRLRDYRFQVDNQRWSAVQCRDCGLGYLNPRPAIQEITRYYPHLYFDHRKHQMSRYERQSRYVSGPPGRLLDIGTARGDFLAVMKKRHWEVAGVEPAEADNPHGLPIYRVHFPGGCDALDGRFDVITAWGVFEHLHDPMGAFRASARLLNPGGRLIVLVPNLRSIQSRWALQEDVPRHLYFFTAKTLRGYADETGLMLERVHHDTDLFGGSGRGVLRLALVRAAGRSTDDFFELLRSPRRVRFRRWPILATAWTAVAGVERLLLADWIIRTARLSGIIVAEFKKPVDWRGDTRRSKSTYPGASSD
jgi:SAM-dependent methyltransferase